MPQHDLFVSHNGADKLAAERLCLALLDRGLQPWFDKWELQPGDARIVAIERALADVPVVLACVGEHGMSGLSDVERQAAAIRAGEQGVGRVVPVLLPGGPDREDLPLSLQVHEPVDLREEQAWEAGIRALVTLLTPEQHDPPVAEDPHLRPYLGLEPFKERDAGWMFGRKDEERRLLDALRGGERFLPVIGASGSGKSSLVRAGLLPAVRTGGIDGKQCWRALVMQPGPHPCNALALLLLRLQRVEGEGTDLAAGASAVAALREVLVREESALLNTVEATLGAGDRDEQLLLVIDQFEELFVPFAAGPGGSPAPAPLGAEALAFLRGVLFATSHPGGRVRVVLTMRADFVKKCLEVPELGARLDRIFPAMTPMKAPQLREAIRRPALRAGYDVEEALLTRLVEETADKPGQLPLLQYSLAQLWDDRDRVTRRLTHAAYTRLGSLGGSVARKAEQVYCALPGDPSEREATVRRVFLRLVHTGQDTDDTRRQMRRSELAGDAAAEQAIERFIAGRLLVTSKFRGDTDTADEDAVELAHEALLSRWERLRGWLAENREARRLHRDLGVATSEWLRRQRARDELWRGGRLVRVWELHTKRVIAVSKDELAFLVTSRRAEKKARRVVIAVVILGFSALSIGIIAVLWQSVENARLDADNAKLAAESVIREGERAREQSNARIAARGEQGSQAALLARVPGKELAALELGVRAVGDLNDAANTPPPLAVRGLGEALARSRRVKVVEVGAELAELVWNPDGTRFATTSADGAVKLWDAATGVLIGSHAGYEKDEPILVAWSGDGSRLISGLYDSFSVWDRELRPLGALDDITMEIDALAVNHDGSRIALSSWYDQVGLWDGRTGERITMLGGKYPLAAAWTADGTCLATADRDGRARLWDSQRGLDLSTVDDAHARLVTLKWRPTRTGHVPDGKQHPLSLAWTAAGLRLATIHEDLPTVRLWDGASDVPLGSFDGSPKITDLAWAPDGARVATAHRDGTARLWDGTTGRPLAIFADHDDSLMALAWRADGKRLATASADGTVKLWHGEAGGDPALHASTNAAATLSPPLATLHRDAKDGDILRWTVDGTRLAVGHLKEATIWDVETGDPVVLRGHTGPVSKMAWSADGSRIVTAEFEKTVMMWDAGTGARLARLEGHTGLGVKLVWRSDGERMISWDTASVRLWDERGTPLSVLSDRRDPTLRLAWRPGGTELVITGEAGTLLMGQDMRVRSSEPANDVGSRALAWAADGTRVAVAGGLAVAVLDATTGGRLCASEPLSSAIQSVAWAPDGRRLAVTVQSFLGFSRVQLLDGRTCAGLEHFEPKANISTLAWSTDGTRLVTAGGPVQLWDASGKPVTTVHPDGQAAWSPAGSRLATLSEGKVWLRDAIEGKERARLEGHAGAIEGMDWTPNGTQLATIGDDHTVRLWDGLTGAPITVFASDSAGIWGIQWSPDGTLLAVASDDGAVRIWRNSLRSWQASACEILEGSALSFELDPETKQSCAALASTALAAPGQRR